MRITYRHLTAFTLACALAIGALAPVRAAADDGEASSQKTSQQPTQKRSLTFPSNHAQPFPQRMILRHPIRIRHPIRMPLM